MLAGALLGDLTALPKPLAGFKGPTSKGRGGFRVRGRRGGERKGQGGEGKEGKGKGGKGKARVETMPPPFLSHM